MIYSWYVAKNGANVNVDRASKNLLSNKEYIGLLFLNPLCTCKMDSGSAKTTWDRSVNNKYTTDRQIVSNKD